MGTQEDRFSAAKAATDRFHEAARELAFFPKALERSDFACFEPFFPLAFQDELYCHGLSQQDEADSGRIASTLQDLNGKTVHRALLVSNDRHERPWKTNGPTLETQLGQLLCTALDKRMTIVKRLYRRGSSRRRVTRVRRLYLEHLGYELSSNLRGTFTDGLEDQVLWGLEECLELTLFALLANDQEIYRRLAAALPVLRRCAPLAEHPREPGTWYVFVR